jgi:hypothetical protein
MSQIRYFIGASFFSLTVLAGCATHTHTVRTETVEQAPPARVERETTRTETTRTDADGGVLSTTVDTVGEVLAWPFRLVGGAVRALF